ncbi:MAG: hypothetical protein GY830_09085 [Bacteroidetes bacterium]|nr:hypothetical protein [Bacteroidota bacterium]
MRKFSKSEKQDAKLNRICARAIENAKENNRKNGVPNAFVENDKIYFEMPDGKITDKNPFTK